MVHTRVFDRPAHALVRTPSDAYERCLRERPARIDLTLARAQHATYVRALEQAGVQVTVLPPSADLPDAVFPEDTAVIADGRALLTRLGAAVRQPEVAGVAPWVRAHAAVQRVSAPGTLEGGDVMRVGDTLFCGLSGRTNAAGFAQLAALAARCGLRAQAVALPRHMHLKGHVSVVGPRAVIIDPHVLRPDAFLAHGLRVFRAAEQVGANVLALGDCVLVPAEAPATARRLARAGHHVQTVPGSEFHNGDGRLTCLSLRVARPGAWCA